MMKNRSIYLPVCASMTLLQAALPSKTAGQTTERPNILWLTFEDTSPYEIGCYGNPYVHTPTIDSLARNGIRFTNAYSNAPQSSPARSCIITGCFSTTYAMDWHRKQVLTPEGILFPQYLRDAGYYCTNNQKTDYNTNIKNSSCWDECNSAATYNSPKRGKDQPFFAVFNSGLTHMSRLASVHLDGRRDFAAEGLDPQKLELPPHVPDIPAIRSDYAFHMEGVNDVDKWVKIFLDDLKQKGLDDNTIVFVFSDHGGCLPRGKAFSYETSYRVPMVVYLPPKWQHLSKMAIGQPSDRMVCFTDLAATMLSAVGIEPPARLQGLPFLGQYDRQERQYQFGLTSNRSKHYVPTRSVSNGRYKYIRYYIPYKLDALFNYFQWEMPANLYWDKTYLEGQCRSEACVRPYEYYTAESLYDLQNDPFELHDLINDKSLAPQLETLRAELSAHIRRTQDLGFLPITAREGDIAPYDRVRQPGYDLEQLYQLAELTATVDRNDIPQLTAILRSNLPDEFKFWATVNLSVLARSGRLPEAPAEMLAMLESTDTEAASEAAYGLCYTDRQKEAFDYLAAHPENPNALELLALDPEMRERFPENIMAMLEQESEKYATTPRTKMPGPNDGVGIRKVMVNLGRISAEELYGPYVYDLGVKVNETRRKIQPLPVSQTEKKQNQPHKNNTTIR